LLHVARSGVEENPPLKLLNEGLCSTPNNGNYYYCKATAKDGTVLTSDYADFTCKITHQPTDKAQCVFVNDSEGASYQWYVAKCDIVQVTKENYKNNKKVGKATVTIKGKGNYKGTLTKTFKINPKPTKITKIVKGSKSFMVKWSKRTTQTTGYQIYYTTSTTRKNGKTVTLSKTSTISKKISSLKSKKKYYVWVRTYRTVNGTKYYSQWSSRKSVTTKK